MSELPAQPASSAIKVAIGIFASRIVGLLRQRAVAHFFGIGAHADVFQAAFRAPNLLQNLLGEGTISAAFIPIYSQMLDEGRHEDAGRFAGAIFGLLIATAASLALIGVLLAQPIVTVFAPGFLADSGRVAEGAAEVDRFALTVKAVRIIFPMTGILVLSAWALGVLNSHRKFLLPYLAPVAWNAAIIAGLFIAGSAAASRPAESLTTETLTRILLAGCWGALVGGLLQFLVQVPGVWKVIKGFRLTLSTRVPGVRASLRAFGPVVAGRGVYQLSAYLDQFLASFLAVGALSAILYAQLLYLLPISLFGMSVAASELPELSRIREQDITPFAGRLERSFRQIMFLTLPTLVGYLAFGLLVVGALYRTGSFGLENNWLVYIVLAAYSLGLPATTGSRLLQNASYALRDTRTPARIAAIRVAVSTVVSIPAMFLLDRVSVEAVIGRSTSEQTLFLGAAGLAVGSAVGAWLELWRLRVSLRRRLSGFDLPWRALAGMVGVATAAVAPAALLWWYVSVGGIILQALLVVGVYALTYLGLARLFRLDEMQMWLGQVLRRFRSP